MFVINANYYFQNILNATESKGETNVRKIVNCCELLRIHMNSRKFVIMHKKTNEKNIVNWVEFTLVVEDFNSVHNQCESSHFLKFSFSSSKVALPWRPVQVLGFLPFKSENQNDWNWAYQVFDVIIGSWDFILILILVQLFHLSLRFLVYSYNSLVLGFAVKEI